MSSHSPGPAWPTHYLGHIGHENYILGFVLRKLAHPITAAEDARTEALAAEQPHLQRTSRRLWVVPGGEQAIARELGMTPEAGPRRIRRWLRKIEDRWFAGEDRYFAIWRKDPGKQRQEVNAYDLDEWTTRIEEDLAQLELPLSDAELPPPGSPPAEPAFLPLGGGAEPPETLIDTPNRSEEAGLGEQIVGREKPFEAPPARSRMHPPRRRTTSAAQRGATAPQTPSGTHGRQGPSGSQGAVTGPPTAAGGRAESSALSAGHFVRQEGRIDLDPIHDHIPVTPTHARPRPREAREGDGPGRSRRRRQRRRVVQTDSPGTLAKAQLIRERFPGFWPAEALKRARQHTLDHIRLCLDYVDVERNRRKLDNDLGFLREVLRAASPVSMRRRLDLAAQEERLRREQAAERQRSEYSPEEIEAFRAEYERFQEERSSRTAAPPRGGKGEFAVLEVKPPSPVAATRTSRISVANDNRFAGWDATRRQAAELGIDTTSPGWLFALAKKTDPAEGN